MKRSVFFTLLCILSGSAVAAGPFFQPFDKASIYSALASGSLSKIDSELSVVAGGPGGETDAYTGALLMRKAGLLRRPKEKLSTFRSGATRLERALARDSTNAEYHFLRLMIQEHAPKVLHYDRNRDKDSQIVVRAFPTLLPVLQKAIRNYCAHSRLIHERDLNG
jgi:hypothetical protein